MVAPESNRIISRANQITMTSISAVPPHPMRKIPLLGSIEIRNFRASHGVINDHEEVKLQTPNWMMIVHDTDVQCGLRT